MSKPTNPFLIDEGLDDLAADCSDDDGLCCPDDPIDDVIMGCYPPVLDYGFMHARRTGCDSRPRPADGRGDERKDALEVLPAEVDFDVDMFFADSTPDDGGVCGGAASNYMSSHAAITSELPAALALADPCGALDAVADTGPPHYALDGIPPVSATPLLAAHYAPDGIHPVSATPLLAAHYAPVGIAPISAQPLLAAHDALDGAMVPYRAPPLQASHDALDGAMVPYRAPPLPAHNAVPAVLPPTTTSSTSSGSASSMTWETDSLPRVSPLQAPWPWFVPRKNRSRPVTRRNHFWPSLLLDADTLPAAPRATPILPKTGGNGEAGVSRKRPVIAQKRNRQRQRECSHCSNTETPQWRAGPRGPGTLCNACGIRFKGGKLLEDYRPSTSPSFESGKHSNRHRKVVKLMEKKAALLKMAGDTAPAPPPGDGGEFMDVCTYIATG